MESNLIFLFKKVVGNLLMPVPVCLMFLVMGLILLLFSKRQTAGKTFVAIGTSLLLVFGYAFIPDRMAQILEYRNPSVLKIDYKEPPKYIVVLGSGHNSDPRLPENSQLGCSGVSRLVEAIRLYHMIPDSKFILSGWGGSDPVPNARVMAKAASDLGIDSDSIILATTPKDTKDEARIISGMVDGKPFLLVTSAAHMPRSLSLFRKQGANPIPAPTDYRVKKTRGFSYGLLFPSSENMVTARRAIHEYLGLLWAVLRNQI